MISFLDQDFGQLNDYLSNTVFSKIYILVDENTHEYCLPTLLGNISGDFQFEIIEIEAGEEMKNIETAVQLWEILTEMQADRKALMMNLGGGVISDLGGFVASTFKRGIRFINVPTTLLAMCDASVGGKTGIDLAHHKNMVGTFTAAEQTFIYPKFLETLPLRELKSGFAEMLKHGLIADKNHWEDLISLQSIDAESIADHIQNSVKIKHKIVEKDFHEENLRKTLNFGHTVGHAIESLFLAKETPILHGEAVAAGMICETYISLSENLIDEETCENIILNIAKHFPMLDLTGFSDEELLALMRNDKKNEDGEIRFSIISEIGSCLFDQSISTQTVINSLKTYVRNSGF
jgi:3-dehydroquinate synthase